MVLSPVKELVYAEQTHCKSLITEHQHFFLLLSCSKQESNQRILPETFGFDPWFRTSLSHIRTMSEIARALNMRCPSRAVSLAVPNGHATSRHTGVWTWVQEDAGGVILFIDYGKFFRMGLFG